jgi:predicted DNA-binding antitoxin AbrB/MazE fold protein
MRSARIAAVHYAIDATYENGTFRPVHGKPLGLIEGQRVRIMVDDLRDPEALRLAMSVYDGLSANQIAEIEKIALATGATVTDVM